jgi:hypothetical protein
MPIPGLAILGGLARGGILRGTLGKILRGGSGGVKMLPGGGTRMNLPATLPTFPRQAGRLIKSGGKLAAGGAAWEAGSRIVRGFGDEDMPRRRRMNHCNIKALKRAVRRVEGGAKMYAKVLQATKGTRSKGYTIKPRIKKRSS